VNFDTAIAVLKARLSDLDSRDIPHAQRRQDELRSELVRVRNDLLDMLRERGHIRRAIEELGGEVE